MASRRSSLGGFGAPGGGAVAFMETAHLGTTALLLDGSRMQVVGFEVHGEE